MMPSSRLSNRPGEGSPRTGVSSNDHSNAEPSKTLRSGALKPPRTGTRARDTVSPRAVRDEAQVKARRVAHDNAADMEWYHTIRPGLRDMAQRGMSAAETGVRLADLLRRAPSLIADGQGLCS